MTPEVEDIKTLLLRDLRSMEDQLRAYATESDIWATPPGIDNSAGTLALHCAGNLRHFVGGELGGTGYHRERDREFSARNVPREELLEVLSAAAREVSLGLEALSPGDLDARAELPGGKSATRRRFLHHLCVHLTYHLGQMDYHRRMVTGAGPLPGIVGLGALDPGV